MEIQGFNNYLIYPDGLVFNQKSNKFMKWSEHNRGYHTIQLYKDGKQQNILLHRLIAIHYIPNPDNYPQVDHIDGNKQNNDISNLRWVTNEINANSFKSRRSDNKSGHKNIHYHKLVNIWVFEKIIYGKRY